MAIMRYATYGKTGKRVSVIGFGGMRFDTGLSQDENAELVRYASSKGINYFDTAPGYCGDQSEDIYGLAFQDMPGEFFVSTKGMTRALNTNYDWGILHGHVGAAARRVGCGQCEEKCTQHIRIPERLREIAAWDGFGGLSERGGAAPGRAAGYFAIVQVLDRKEACND
jgi:predicted aldo/keto reductase-like oxidoreductase